MNRIDRRTFIRAGAIAAAGSAVSACATGGGGGGSAGGRPPIVLVHGAWHGGWCWARVEPPLRAAGHRVFSPTLTGVGERVHLAGPSVNLETHITDVVNVIEAEELKDVVLVGHSYAGMVITGVADRLPGRLRSIVYVDAFLPENGRSMIDYVAPARQPAMKKAGETAGYLDSLPINLLGVRDPTDAAWVQRRVTRQPYPTFSQPIRLTRNALATLPRTYVYCSDPPTGSFDQFAAKLRTDPGWKFHELKTGHDCMVTEPAALAKIILGAA
jgi:pimeloyl-ACP methyl ester carboxylesterase